MRVLVVNNMAPFIWGGAEELAAHLVKHLNDTKGVSAELMRVPFRWDPAERILEEIFICKSMRLARVDRMLALKFPAYLIPHEEKTLWLLHQYRQAYDLRGSALTNLPPGPRGDEICGLIKSNDEACFRSCSRIFVNSVITQERLHRFNGFASELLLPPVNDPERFRGGGYGNYIFAGGRVNLAKRQHLLIEAMAQVRSPIILVVGGPPDSSVDRERLERTVSRFGLGDRVKLDLGFLSREKIAHYVSNALACAYLPVDEDSPGYVTMEAFTAGKSVLTVSDSGGVLDIVKDEVTGLVAAAEPAALANAIDRLASNKNQTIKFGEEARSLWRKKNVNWPSTIQRLLS
jgi:glycosyltransferase involved in cell wall biosynthesis